MQFQKGHVLPCGQRLSKLVDGDHELGDILNGKLPSAALPGVGHKYIISFGPLKMKTSNPAILLNILYPQQYDRTLPAVLDSCTFYFCLA
jgi:hypothetical protein